MHQLAVFTGVNKGISKNNDVIPSLGSFRVPSTSTGMDRRDDVFAVVDVSCPSRDETMHEDPVDSSRMGIRLS